MVKVISITNQKGGTGKTTLSAILAYGLNLLNKRVLLIDLDPQAHLSSFFVKVSELDKFQESFHLARGDRFKIVKINNKLGLIPSRLSYIIAAYRGEMPSGDPFAID